MKAKTMMKGKSGKILLMDEESDEELGNGNLRSFIRKSETIRRKNQLEE